ncbi:hypothetical protein CCMSSC00406_0005559 [Pleurotus cornucopiae]|uniref:Uncharacterized protein n=1 Tax=Pleurotus cornucopiae TaxID=5321 RepID=A0ACB7IXP0_PLECO|nr:hypothetical protein CCMSSC00406_0005559 [Pleurotus cornucopiae]
MTALDTEAVAVDQFQIASAFSVAAGKDVAERLPNPGTNRNDSSTTAIGLNTPGQEEEEMEEEEEEEDTKDTAGEDDDDGNGHEHADDPIPNEILREGVDVEDPQTGKPQIVTDTKATQTQPAHIDAGSEQAERQDGADDEEEEEEEKEEPEEEPEEDGPPIPNFEDAAKREILQGRRHVAICWWSEEIGCGRLGSATRERIRQLSRLELQADVLRQQKVQHNAALIEAKEQHERQEALRIGGGVPPAISDSDHRAEPYASHEAIHAQRLAVNEYDQLPTPNRTTSNTPLSSGDDHALPDPRPNDAQHVDDTIPWTPQSKRSKI